jgi:low affinity Fe/Cu permease
VEFSDSAEDLQVQLNNRSEYCDTWKLIVNISITRIVVFTKALLHHFNFSYKGSNLEIVKDYICLGINLSNTVSYLNIEKKMVGKAAKAMYEVLRKVRVHNLSLKCQYDLFDKIVKPILLYGCEI